jgi:hypothetical protein
VDVAQWERLQPRSFALIVAFAVMLQSQSFAAEAAPKKVYASMNFLAIVLFLPWFAIIGFAYWHLPLGLPRPVPRRVFDITALLLGIGVASIAALVAMTIQWQDAGRIWPQVAAVLFAYAAFLTIVLLAAGIRQRIWNPDL